MKKLLLALMFTLTLSLAIPTTFANTNVDGETNENYQEALAIADYTNAEVEALIEFAQFAAKFTTNDDFIIDLLVSETDRITQNAIEEIEELGFEAVCTYVPYDIDGQIVYIDPIEVLGW